MPPSRCRAPRCPGGRPGGRSSPPRPGRSAWSPEVAGLPAGMAQVAAERHGDRHRSWREGALERDRAVGDPGGARAELIVHGSLVKNWRPTSMTVRPQHVVPEGRRAADRVGEGHLVQDVREVPDLLALDLERGRPASVPQASRVAVSRRQPVRRSRSSGPPRSGRGWSAGRASAAVLVQRRPSQFMTPRIRSDSEFWLNGFGPPGTRPWRLLRGDVADGLGGGADDERAARERRRPLVGDRALERAVHQRAGRPRPWDPGARLGADRAQ